MNAETRIEPTEWVVIPAGIEATRFKDPEAFYLRIRKGRWKGEPCYIVSGADRSSGFTRRGKVVYLRYDVNAKHARLDTFEEAAALARDLADGTLPSDDYQTWRAAEAMRFGGPPSPTLDACDA